MVVDSSCEEANLTARSGSGYQDVAGGSPRAVTPEGINGLFVTVNHSDYVSARDTTDVIRLYPIDGGEPKAVPGLTEVDEVIGSSPDSNALYVSPDPSAIPQQIMKHWPRIARSACKPCRSRTVKYLFDRLSNLRNQTVRQLFRWSPVSTRSCLVRDLHLQLANLTLNRRS